MAKGENKKKVMKAFGFLGFHLMHRSHIHTNSYKCRRSFQGEYNRLLRKLNEKNR